MSFLASYSDLRHSWLIWQVILCFCRKKKIDDIPQLNQLNSSVRLHLIEFLSRRQTYNDKSSLLPIVHRVILLMIWRSPDINWEKSKNINLKTSYQCPSQKQFWLSWVYTQLFEFSHWVMFDTILKRKLTMLEKTLDKCDLYFWFNPWTNCFLFFSLLTNVKCNMSGSK